MCWVFLNEHFLSKKCVKKTLVSCIAVCIFTPTMSPPIIRLGQKRWRTEVGIEIFCSPGAPFFFPSGEGDVRSFGLLLLPMCSHQVLNVFLLSSQCVPQHVLNSTSLCLICFVQCCPILELISLYGWSEYFYIGGVSPNLQNFFGILQSKRPH
jgi:hypothetical protein